MTTPEGTRLRRALRAHTSGRGKRYNVALKSRVVAFARDQRGQRRSWAKIATELDLRFETLRRWCATSSPRSPSGRAMRRVEIVPEPAARSLTLVSPSGVRVEGVTVDEAVALLRALG